MNAKKLFKDVELNRSSEVWSLLLALTSLVISIVAFLVVEFSQFRLVLIAVAIPLTAAVIAAILKVISVRKP